MKHNIIDDGGIPGEDGSPLFTADMLGYFDDANESWIGKSYADNIASFPAEEGSPVITAAMVAEATDNPFNQFELGNGIILWNITAEYEKFLSKVN